VRAQAPRTPATSNPQLLGARATHPPPVPTPATEPPLLTLWTWTGMLARLDLLPQRNIGRHVQWAPPYDGHQGGSAPYEPSRSHQDWEGSLSSVVEPGLHVGGHVRLPHLARGLILVPDTSPVANDDAAPSSTRLATTHRRPQRAPPKPATPASPRPAANITSQHPGPLAELFEHWWLNYLTRDTSSLGLTYLCLHPPVCWVLSALVKRGVRGSNPSRQLRESSSIAAQMF